MSRCRNCGRETLRTEDWACKWCGHPLLYGSYKKIEKTYQQLKEERLNKFKDEAVLVQKNEIVPEIEIPPKQDLGRIKGIELEPETEVGKEKNIDRGIEEGQVWEVEDEEVEKIEEPEKEATPESEIEPIQELETGKEVEVKPEEEIKPQSESADEKEIEEIQESEIETKDEVKLIKEPEFEENQETEPETELTEVPEPEPEIGPPDMELTVEEILKAYEEDDIAANEKFVDKILRVRGMVSMIDIKDKLDIHYIRIIGGAGDPWQSLQCMFDKKHSSALGELEKGQTVTAQGRYNGSVIAIRMVDCVLVL